MAKRWTAANFWEPPTSISKDEMVKISEALLTEPDIEFTETEDVFRIRANEMDWDIGCMVYEPTDPSKAAVGPDGKKLGIIMTHGGASDWRSIEPLAQTFTGKRGYKVCSMTYPGRLYLPDSSRDWPDDTLTHLPGRDQTLVPKRRHAWSNVRAGAILPFRYRNPRRPAWPEGPLRWS